MSNLSTKTTSQMRNYYEILNSRISDPIEDIKKAYQLLLLKYHPDKQREMQVDNVEDSSQFHQIDEAWKTLRDPVTRRSYDAELNQHKFNQKPIVHDTLTLDEFETDIENEVYVYPCRCGGFFVIPFGGGAQDGLDEDETFIACDECSLVIQLIKKS